MVFLAVAVAFLCIPHGAIKVGFQKSPPPKFRQLILYIRNDKG